MAVGVEAGRFVLARPLVDWGPRQDVFPPDGHRFTREDLLWFSAEVTRAAESIVAGRRRSFRWCPTCCRPSAPEGFDRSEGMCASCLAVYERFDE